MVFDEQVVKRLLDCDWLVNCGRTDVEIPGVRCEWLTDRERIVKNFNGVKWENTCIDAENDVTSYLFSYYPEIYHGEWNKRVDNAKLLILPKVESIISSLIKNMDLPEKICDFIYGDIISIMVISSYKEYYHSDFFEMLLDIYTSGHLPCGWHGRYPKGVIMVY